MNMDETDSHESSYGMAFAAYHVALPSVGMSLCHFAQNMHKLIEMFSIEIEDKMTVSKVNLQVSIYN